MDRATLLSELLDEFAAHSPAAAMRHMRQWPGGALSLVHVNVLAILDIDGPMPMGGLAEALDVSQASATGIVDRMEQRGLVERRRIDDDRRVVRVALTDEGRRLIAGMAAERREHLAAMLETLTDAELEGFVLGSRAPPPRPRAPPRRQRAPARDPPMIHILRTWLRPYTWPITFVMVLLLIQAIANLYLPALNADIINNGVAKGDTDYILATGGFMLVVTFALMIAAIVGVYFSARIAMGFGRDVRSAIFRKVETFSQVEVNRFGTASLITRNTNDVQQVQHVVLMALNMMISAPILTVGGLIMALRQDVPLSGILLVIIPIMAVLIGVVMSRAIPLFQAMQTKLDRIINISGNTTTSVFSLMPIIFSSSICRLAFESSQCRLV